MRDHIKRTAEVIEHYFTDGIPGTGWGDDGRAVGLAHALDNAGRLVSPEHDRQVAANALREAADEIDNPSATPEVESAADAASHLYDRADRIEKGETDE